MAVTLTPGTAVQSTTSVTTLTPTLPSGLVSGDYVLVVATSNASGGGFTGISAGWTAVLASTDSVNGSTSLHGAIWVRKWVNGDTSPVLTFASGRAGAICIRVNGADPTTFLNVAASVTQGTGTTQTTVSAPTLTPTAAGIALVTTMFARSATGNTFITFTTPAGMTTTGYARGNDTTTTNSALSAFYDNSETSGVATGVRTSTLSTTATGSFGAAFLINPAGGGTTYQGAVSLSATATLTTDGVVSTPGAVSLTATASLSPTANQTFAAAVSLTSTTALTTVGIRSTAGIVSLVSGATLTAAGSTFATFSGAVTLTTSQSLTANGLVSTPGLGPPVTGLIHRMRPNLGLTNGAAVASVPFELGGLTIAQVTPAARPTFVASGVNGQPALHFDGVDDGLTSTVAMTALNQPLTMVAIIVPTNAARKEEIIHGGGAEIVLNFNRTAELWAGGSLVGAINMSATVPSSVLMEYNGVSSAIYVDGTLDVSGNGGTAGLTAVIMAVGYHPTPGPDRFTGDLYEILVYNKVLSSGEKSTLTSYVNSTYRTPATSSVSLVASASLTANGIRTQAAAVSLISASTLTTLGIRSTDGAVSLVSGTTLTADGITTKAGAVSLSASASLTSAVTTLTTTGAVSLTTVQSLTSNGVREQPGAATLQAAPALTVAGSLTAAAGVSLTATAGLTSLGIRVVIGASTLTVVPTLTVAGATGQTSAVSLPVTASLTSAGTLGAFGAVALISTATFVVPAQLPGGAVSLLATGTLGLTGGLNAFGVVSLSALPSLTISSIRITSASVTLGVSSALLVSASQQVMVSSVSLISTSSLSINLGAVGATATLTVAKTLTVGASFTAFAAVSLSSTSTLSVTGRLGAFGSVTVAAVPVLTVGVSVGITNGSALLSALGVLTAGGIRITNATVVPLVASGSLSVNGLTGSGGSTNLIATSSLLVAGVAVRVSATQLTVLSTLTVNASVGALGAVTLLAGASLSSVGVISRLGSVLLITSQTLLASGSSFLAGSVLLRAVPVLTFVDLFPEIDMSVGGSWDGGGIHTDSSPRPKSYLTPAWSGSESSTGWSTGGIHVG
jgi:hypothetical protein